MRLLGLLHHHPVHRARQLRWVLPAAALLLAATLTAFVVQYHVSNQAVGAEFFRAHKTIGHTGELLERGTLIGGAVITLLVLAIAVWALRFTHRIVRPVHTVHRALEALVAGDLGVRVELHRADEFREVGDSLNRLVDIFATTLATVHALVDRIAALTSVETGKPQDQATALQLQALITELDRTMEFFRLEPRRTIREDDC
jgi:methyl-accepting chemotaxis protein